MSPDLPFQQSLDAVSRFLVGNLTVQETLTRVAHLGLAALPGARDVGVTMLEDGHPATSVFTDPEVVEIDQAQYDSDSGPCLDVFRTGEIFRIGDTSVDGPWPDFRKVCLRHGIASTLSMPLVFDDICYGAFNVYAEAPEAFGPSEIRNCRTFSVASAMVLANSKVYWQARNLSENFEKALKHRAEIEMAKGIIMNNSRLHT